MKHVAPYLKYAFITLLLSSLMITCRKAGIDPPPAEPPDPSDTVSTGPANTNTNSSSNNLADRLLFANASKKQGTIPAGPGSSSLKISVKDTLRITEGVKIPIKFLHDASTNIAGVYIQVIGATGGVFDYYDVAELHEVSESDTVSAILIGFDPADLELPMSFDITIVPHTESGQPLDETVLPVIVEDGNDDPNKPGSCGIVLPQGDFWHWELSYIEEPSTDSIFRASFVSTPGMVFGAGGQDIKGSCCNGVSIHGICNGDSLPNASLHFATFYEIRSETFVFSDNKTFLRQTFEKTANPFTDESDFCGSGPGVVHEKLNHTVYNGNWALQSAPVPARLEKILGKTNNVLTLQGTSSTGGGFGNPGGYVLQLDCNVLILVQIDREGGDQDLVKIYSHVTAADALWYPL